MLLIEKTLNWYGRFERPISSLSFIFGFVVDSLTLKRVDIFRDNLQIAFLLFVAGLFIVLTHMQEAKSGDEKNPQRAHFWYVNILQFAFGGLLSAYLVFYFRSADIFTAWPFILLLALAVFANEYLKKHYVRFSFQISLFFLSVYAFAIFLLPVVLHKIGAWVFLLSGAMSLAFIALFSFILSYFVRQEFVESKRLIVTLVLGIFAVVNLFYFTNLIPPIPLSLKDAGVYHSLQKNSEGNYNVTYESSGWQAYFKPYQEFNAPAGAPVYAYSAIFSPKELNTTIVHEWQFYNNAQGKWITERSISLPVVGGRDGGFRTYSTRSNLAQGKWRVKIKTERGQTIGHIRFNMAHVATEPNLIEDIKK